MRLDLPKPGLYILAVSGGVDSMTLLNLASQKDRDKYSFIVAHVDHGIRPDSHLDKELVENMANTYSMPFVSKRLHLSADASEELARKKRYDFLHSLLNDNKAYRIITAHHQDDLIETVLINLIRGTNRKGFTALLTNDLVIRPLVRYSKSDLINYAKKQKLVWREDSTNQDDKYLRNYLRHNIIPKLDTTAKTQLLSLINNMSHVNGELDNLITGFVGRDNNLDRRLFNSLPHKVSLEVLAYWLRQNQIRSFKKSTLERLAVNAKIGTAGNIYPVQNNINLKLSKEQLALVSPER